MVTVPEYVLVPVVLLCVKVPETEVVPITVILLPVTVNVVPDPTLRFPLIDMAVAVDAVIVPEVIKSPLIVATLVNVFAPEPDSCK